MANGFEPGRGQGVGLPRRGRGGFTVCRCPACGYEEEHDRNVPCNRMRCPKCGTYMVGS